MTLPVGKDSVNFKPIPVKRRLPDPSTQPWPMGDVLPKTRLPAELDAAKLKLAVDAFGLASGMTAAFVVTWKGRLIGERYGQGITTHTPLESWSMGKSVTATLMGILIKQGVYDLWQPAPIPEWQGRDDPRRKIRIADIMRMSSGLRMRAPRIPTTTRPAHIPITTTSIRGASTPSTTPPPARCSGRPAPWAATATPIRC